MACTYWIKLPHHSDIISEGYIGFTIQKFAYRMLAHKNAALKGRPQVICNAIRKYGWDNLHKSILCIGSDEYCLDLEKKLRPKENIGWNIGIGGGAAFIGCKHSEDAKKRLSLAMKGLPKSAQARINIGLAAKGRKASEQARNNMREAKKNFVFSESHKKAISSAKKGIVTAPVKWLSPHAKQNTWLAAEELYRLHLSTPTGNISTKRLPVGIYTLALCRMRRHFKRGWNPHTDQEYQAWKVSLAA